MRVVDAPVSGDAVVRVESWCSLWADLLHVDMVLLAREGLAQDPRNLFARRALWEGAVIAYGRTVKPGRRQVLLRNLLDELLAEANRCHDDVMRWRDKHVAPDRTRSAKP